MSGSDKCKNCGGDRAIHHYQTDQCPVGGREAPADRPQNYKTSTFEAEIPFDPPSRLVSSMTLREYFAAMAMQGMIANPSAHDPDWVKDPDESLLCRGAVNFADALIDALNQAPRD